MRLTLGMGLAVLLIVAACGCGTSEPTLAGGKPVSYWVEQLQHSDAAKRKLAVQKLGNVGSTQPAVVPGLLGALKDRDAIVRREAILALLKCGPAAQDAVPAITDLRDHDRDATVRSHAAKALEALQKGKATDSP
jgi:HEAT repeat protein